jgi:hypothetical protein
MARSGMSSINLAPNKAGVFRCDRLTLLGSAMHWLLLRPVICTTCSRDGWEMFGRLVSSWYSVSG